MKMFLILLIFIGYRKFWSGSGFIGQNLNLHLICINFGSTWIEPEPKLPKYIPEISDQVRIRVIGSGSFWRV